MKTEISQGNVMRRLRCGGIVKSYNNCKFTAESVGVRNSENLLTFGEVVDKSSVSCFFWLTEYIVFVLIRFVLISYFVVNDEDKFYAVELRLCYLITMCTRRQLPETVTIFVVIETVVQRLAAMDYIAVYVIHCCIFVEIDDTTVTCL